MSRATRLLDLLTLLRRRRRPVTAAQLAEELGVSKRTVYRDVEALISLGAPIRGEAGAGYLLRPGFLLPPLMFTEEELEALALGGRWVAEHGDRALATAAGDALAKIAAVLPLPLAARLGEPGLMAVRTGPPPLAGPVDAALVRAAIRHGRKLRLVYADEAGRRSERVVWPIALVYFEATRLLAAWCEQRGEFRHFRLDRIAEAALDGCYPRRRAALLAEWQAQDEASGRRPSRARAGRTRAE